MVYIAQNAVSDKTAALLRRPLVSDSISFKKFVSASVKESEKKLNHTTTSGSTVNKKPSYCWDSQPFVAIFRT